MAEKRFFNEICLIRVLLIFLLIIYHSFAPFCKSWAPVGTGREITSYYWIGLLAYSFMLEMFVFISGYIFGYQQLKKGGDYLHIVRSKFKRIIIPSLLFSFLYILLFRYEPRTTWQWIIETSYGVGHLWFLPMLFWCFILTMLIEKSNLSYKWTFIIVLGLAVFSGIEMPFRFNQSLNYLMFFYAGYILRHKDIDLSKYCKPTILIITGIIFLFTVTVGIYSKPYINSWLITKIIKFSYAAFGVIFVFLFAYRLVYIKHVRIAPWFIALSNVCFGVYIFQEFILQIMYYKLNILSGFSDYAIPLIGFIITLIVSLILTIIVRKTKIGRFILG